MAQKNSKRQKLAMTAVEAAEVVAKAMAADESADGCFTRIEKLEVF